MRFLFLVISLIFLFSCGERKEKEKETVFNDPRFNNIPCNKRPSNCEVRDINITNSCNQEVKCGTDKEEEKSQPQIIIIQEQKQDQNQTSENQNNNSNDNSRSIRAIIEGRYYKCWKPCYGCIPPVEITEIQNNMRREIFDEEKNTLDCYRN